MFFSTRLPIIALTVFLSACANNINEGSIRPSHRALIDDRFGNQVILDQQVFFAPDQLTTENGEPKPSVIKGNDNFQITLVSAFICDFREGLFPNILDTTNRGSKACSNGQAGPYGNQDPGTRGEIAILADIVARNGANEPARGIAKQGDFGRVIYYNDDIRETGQLINAVNIPIYGPIRYEKSALQLRLAILELDEEETERTKAIISELAAIGGKAYPPAEPILGILNSLGQIVIGANRNDVEFRFEMTFDPPSKSSRIHRMPLQEGYIAFIREEVRSNRTEWENFVICPEAGKIMLPGCEEDYQQRTWLLLRISREDPDAALAQNAGQLTAEFYAENAVTTEADVNELRERLSQLGSALEALEQEAAGSTPADDTISETPLE